MASISASGEEKWAVCLAVDILFTCPATEMNSKRIRSELMLLIGIMVIEMFII